MIHRRCPECGKESILEDIKDGRQLFRCPKGHSSVVERDKDRELDLLRRLNRALEKR